MGELTKEEKRWIAEKKVMANKFQSLMSYRIPVRDVPEDRAMYSYTSSEPAIYIKKESDLTDGLSESKKRRYRYGLFVSEMLLVQYTDFDYGKSIEIRLGDEGMIFSFISQIIEKGASRRLAPGFIGGKPLIAYQSTVKRIGAKLPLINEAETPFQEFATALLQISYTDMLKGKFNTPEVKNTLKTVYPILIKAMDTPNPDDRMDMALNIMEESRAIWEEELEEAERYSSIKGRKSVISGLMGSLAGFFSPTSGTGSGAVASEPEDPDYSLGAKRESTWEKINAEEQPKTEKENHDKDEKREKGYLNGSETPTYQYDDEAEYDLTTESEYDAEDSEEELEADEFFDDLVKQELEIESSELSSTKKSTVPDFQSVDKKYKLKHYKRKDVLVKCKDPVKTLRIYDDIINNYGVNINKAYKELDKLFRDESSEEEYKTSGRISMKRVSSGKVSSKLFTKKTDPEDLKSIALMIAVDQSGSMACNGRINRAKSAAMALTEVFAKLKIPTYVMGFTADFEGYDAYHYHYTQWHTTTKMDRAMIGGMEALYNNFDGYSIRCASAILRSRPEKHKILMVISDGQPACHAYHSGSSGYSDTKDAIEEAREEGFEILGFGIGDDREVLEKFYGDDYVHLDIVGDLFKGMVDKFKTKVKSW